MFGGCFLKHSWENTLEFRGDSQDEQESIPDWLTIFIMAMEGDVALWIPQMINSDLL